MSENEQELSERTKMNEELPTEQSAATLSGQGAIAQSCGTAVAATGPGSVAIGEVGGDVTILVNHAQEIRDDTAMGRNLTAKQKIALIELVHIGRTWREEFVMVWHDPDGISDILDYDPSPPQVSRGDLLALERERLLICYRITDSKVQVVLTANSYKAVDVESARNNNRTSQ